MIDIDPGLVLAGGRHSLPSVYPITPVSSIFGGLVGVHRRPVFAVCREPRIIALKADVHS